MKILSYIIPEEFQSNNFILSLKQYEESYGKLSKKQVMALRNMLDIRIDFFDWNIPCPINMKDYEENFNKLLEKLRQNKFKKASSWNRHVIAIKSILNSSPDRILIQACLSPHPYNFYSHSW